MQKKSITGGALIIFDNIFNKIFEKKRFLLPFSLTMTVIFFLLFMYDAHNKENILVLLIELLNMLGWAIVLIQTIWKILKEIGDSIPDSY